MIFTRKIKLFPLGDKEEINRVYKYIRDGMFNQNKAMNQYITNLYIEALKEVSKEDRKDLHGLYKRISTSKKGSAYSEDIQFAKGLPTTASVGMLVEQNFKKSCKDGLLYGKVSLPTYKMDNPLLVHVDYVRLKATNPHRQNGLYHNYSNHQDFLDHLYKNDLEILIKFANDITFKVIFGNVHKSAEIRSVFQNIFEEYYKVCGSSIQICGKDIILNLCIDVPKKEIELDEETIVGIDLGIAIPAVCALNNNIYRKKFIGNANDFLRVRTKIQSQKRRLQKNLCCTSGGHGRNKKLKALNQFTDYEKNWVKTYNHMVSKNVVQFAVDNKAKYIHIEDLSGFNTSKFILRNWSYYELQQMIIYKAQKYGIEVRKINPYHTSQICSCCGHWEEGQRISQSEFICKNPECKNYNQKINADYNAARNISLSTKFV